MWGDGYPLLADANINIDSLPAHAKIPSSVDRMIEWAYVQKRVTNDPRRRYELVYAPAMTDASVPSKVHVRFQGIIAVCDLRPTGNHNGCVQRPAPNIRPADIHMPQCSASDSVSSARQVLVIWGGSQLAVMQAQTYSVRLIHDLIRGFLHYPDEYMPPDRKIEFQHVVYNRVSAWTRKLDCVLNNPQTMVRFVTETRMYPSSTLRKVYPNRMTPTTCAGRLQSK